MAGRDTTGRDHMDSVIKTAVGGMKSQTSNTEKIIGLPSSAKETIEEASEIVNQPDADDGPSASPRLPSGVPSLTGGSCNTGIPGR